MLESIYRWLGGSEPNREQLVEEMGYVMSAKGIKPKNFDVSDFTCHVLNNPTYDDFDIAAMVGVLRTAVVEASGKVRYDLADIQLPEGVSVGYTLSLMPELVPMWLYR
ncbi:MAG: hypothetical protein ABIG84_01815 [archaeon]